MHLFSYLIHYKARDSCFACDGRARKVDGRAQALVGPDLPTPLFKCT